MLLECFVHTLFYSLVSYKKGGSKHTDGHHPHPCPLLRQPPQSCIRQQAANLSLRPSAKNDMMSLV